ncbi:MAG: hypothetical protein QOK07_1577 [Gemmatimonadaceae bacterium]|nr:hypothetical protein [Gemmatimonadaceae bacterium]
MARHTQKQQESPDAESRGSDCDQDPGDVRRQMRPFFDNAPNVRQSQQPEDEAGDRHVSLQCPIVRAAHVHAGSVPRELEVYDLRRGDSPNELQPVQIVADSVEESLAAA